MAVNARNGALVASFPVEDSDEIMLVTDGGQLIRVPVHGIRIAGRATQGVIVFDTAEQERVVSVDRIGETEARGRGRGVASFATPPRRAFSGRVSSVIKRMREHFQPISTTAAEDSAGEADELPKGRLGRSREREINLFKCCGAICGRTAEAATRRRLKPASAPLGREPWLGPVFS